MSVIRARLDQMLFSPAAIPVAPERAAATAAGADPSGPLHLNADQRGGVGPNGKPSLTIDEAAVQLTRDGHSWNGPGVTGTAATVTFAFRSTAPFSMPEDTGGFSRFNAAQIAATLEALAAWSDVANLTFNRVGTGVSGEGAYSNQATMLFGNYSTGADGAAAFAYYPTSTNVNSLAGDVWVNSTLSYNTAPVMGGYGVLTLVHEIGHALGLAHPGDYDAGDGGDPINYTNSAEYYEDSHQFTLMSYFTEGNTGGNFGPYYPAAPMLDDIAAAQRLYGANLSTRTGDTVYGFNSTAGRSWFEASVGRAPVFAAWDAGGQDTFDFSGYSNTQIIDLRAGHFSSVGGYVGNVAIAQGAVIENAIGGSGADTLIGNAETNRLEGGAGDDVIEGGAGGDVLFGGDGVGDVASYANSDAGVTVRLFNGTAAGGHAEGDALSGFEGLRGSAFDDELIGTVGQTYIDGGAGDDFLGGLDGADELLGGAGDDRVVGGEGGDTLDGGTGIDTLQYNGSTAGVTVRLFNDTASGGHAEGDTISGFENVLGSDFADFIVGSTAANVLAGGLGADTLSGGTGDDTLDGGSGADRLFGGAGVDLATYAESFAGVTVRLSTGAGLGGFAQGDTLQEIENLVGSAFNDTLIGSTAANTIWGGLGADFLGGLDGADVLDGGADDDRISGGAGADVMTGGDGVDTLIYAGSDLGVTVRLWNDTASGGHADGDVFSGFENVIGSDRKDTLIGSAAANVLSGGLANDFLGGLEGDDVLDGGAGADRLRGGTGFDTASYAGSNARVIVRLWNNTANGGHATGDDIAEIEGLIGSDHDDTLIGSLEANTLVGGAGADFLGGLEGVDTLDGGGGDDRIDGGAGADLMIGGGGADTLIYGGSNAAVTVRLFNSTASGGHADGDVFSGFEHVSGSIYRDTLIGSSVGNNLDGGAGNDFLGGLEGDDILVGGAGDDRMQGGSGSDLFVFEGASGSDLIYDFVAGASLEDLIRLDGAIFTDFADVMAHTTDTGGGAQISKSGVVITLQGVVKADLHENDFTFSASAPPASPSVAPKGEDAGGGLGGDLAASEAKATPAWTDALVAPEAPALSGPMDLPMDAGLGRDFHRLVTSDHDWIW